MAGRPASRALAAAAVAAAAAILVIALIWPSEVLRGFYRAVDSGATPWLVAAASAGLLMIVRRRTRD